MEDWNKKEENKVETISGKKGEIFNLIFDNCRIVIVRKGEINCSLHGYKEKLADRDSIFLVPSGYKLSLNFAEDSSLMIITIDQRPVLQGLDRYIKEDENSLFLVKSKAIINDFINSLDSYIAHGINSPELYKAKTTELLFLLENFYDKQVLAAFFALYLTDDYSFKEQVRLNHMKVKTVGQLADLLHYSYSGFNKRFKRVFGVSAYGWMQQQRARLVYRELLLSEKPLKEISLDYSFVSLSHFNEFCHKELGASPSRIRKNRCIG